MDALDPYYRWLGIAPKDQPPDHYRLLAIDRFEPHPDVISEAADRQMAHLRTHQAGPHGEQAARLLNEIALARVCLLNVEQRAKYDAALRAKLAAAKPAGSKAGSAKAGPTFNWRPSKLVIATAIGAVLFFAVAYASLDRPPGDPYQHAQASPQPAASSQGSSSPATSSTAPGTATPRTNPFRNDPPSQPGNPRVDSSSDSAANSAASSSQGNIGGAASRQGESTPSESPSSQPSNPADAAPDDKPTASAPTEAAPKKVEPPKSESTGKTTATAAGKTPRTWPTKESLEEAAKKFGESNTATASTGGESAVEVATTGDRSTDVEGPASKITAGTTDRGRSPHGTDNKVDSSDEAARGWGKQEAARFTLFDNPITALAVTPDGKGLAACSKRGTLCLIDLTKGEETHRIDGDVSAYHALAMSSSGEFLLTGCGQGQVEKSQLQVWRTALGIQISQVDCRLGDALAVGISRSGDILATAHPEGAVSVRNPRQLAQSYTLYARDRRPAIRALAFAPLSPHLVFGGDGGELYLCRLGSVKGAVIARNDAHTGPVRAVGVDPHERLLLSAGDDGTLRLWTDWKGKGRWEQTLKIDAHPGGALSAQFSADGTQVVTGGADGAVRLWGVRTGEPRGEYTGHTGAVTAVAFVGETNRLCSAGADGTVRVWKSIVETTK